MSIVFVNGQVHQKLPANSEVTFVNGEIVQTLGITPVVEEEAVVLTPLEQLSQDLLGKVNAPLMLHILDDMKLI